MSDVQDPAAPPMELNDAFPHPSRLDVDGIVNTFAHRMMYSVARDQYTATPIDIFQGLAYAVRDRLMERWFETQNAYYKTDAKRVYYLSLEFLMGRALGNNIINLAAVEAHREAMAQLGYRLEEILDREADAGLGNGGLGRLAACYVDSAATLGIPFYGYGIRYEYGIFRQSIQDGFQLEQPDPWLRYGNPWEIARPDSLFPVQFYGRVHHYRDEDGKDRIDWVDTEKIFAMAFDMPVVGYGGRTVNSLRLWAAKSSREFDLAQFNSGDYIRAVEDKFQTENISKVLYPSDEKYAGKELRLKQQYFFCSATLQDLVRRFKKRPNFRWEELPDKVAIQLNDTHPAIAIPELMRVLVDKERLDWNDAWELSREVFAFTNHTVLPEALESWSTEMIGRLLPRHIQIIEEIDRRHRLASQRRFPGDDHKAKRMAVIDEGSVKMANLAIVGSHSINGVAQLHTQILKDSVFREFYEMYPERFNNKTNGITPRRWLALANRKLSRLITEAIGDRWLTELDELRGLTRFADDSEFRRKWFEIKQANKLAFTSWSDHVHKDLPEFNPDTIFDFQVKRIHEYKRQLLNVLHVIDLYHRIQDGETPYPRTVMLAGKAAPSYVIAKLIIKLVHSVAEIVNADPKVSRYLRVAFLPNYGVSCAEKIMPACEISEQISTAGTEASGTGNMKAALNGALTIGTLDGANVEISEEVGLENIFIFGNTTEQINALRVSGYDPRTYIEGNARLKRVVESLSTGFLERAYPGVFRPLYDILTTNDRYFHCADFASYVETQQRAAETYGRRDEWVKMSILNVAGMGKFSSDRSIRDYARDIWKAEPVDPSLYPVGE
jgi:starch phosphorylase